MATETKASSRQPVKSTDNRPQIVLPPLIRAAQESKNARTPRLNKVGREVLVRETSFSRPSQTRLLSTPPRQEAKPRSPLFRRKKCAACKTTSVPRGASAKQDLCEDCQGELALQTCTTCHTVRFIWEFTMAPRQCNDCFQAQQDKFHDGILLLPGLFTEEEPLGWRSSPDCLCICNTKFQKVRYCSTHIGVRPWLRVTEGMVVRVNERDEVVRSRLTL